jgi:hypothetical protein
LVEGAQAVLLHLDGVIPKPSVFTRRAKNLARNFTARSDTRDPSLRLKTGGLRMTPGIGLNRRERIELRSMDSRERLSPQCCRKALRAAGVYQLQRVGLEDALNLVAGVDGPGARGVELDIGLPVLQGLAGLANFFIGES